MTENNTQYKKFVKIIFIILIVIIAVRVAWVNDDSYITFRTVDNFVNGYGLRWNIAERVQSYTHPLWTLTVSVVYFFTREIYFTVLTLSLLLAAFTLCWFAFKVSRAYLTTLFGFLLFMSSKAFMDYTSSGLENVLSYVITILFFWIYFKADKTRKNLFYLSLLTSLAGTNRLDLFLLFVPILIYYFFKHKITGRWKALIIGFLPYIIWELFALIYYGFLFPNTAYAKLGTGYDRFEVIKQGFMYYLNSLSFDPITLMTIALAVIIVIFRKMKSLYPAVIGLILYLCFVLYAGGDFMSGRFFTIPFLIAVIILSQIEIPREPRYWLPLFGLVVIVGLASPTPPVTSDRDFNLGIDHDKEVWTGIWDEREFFYQTAGLLNYRRQDPWPYQEWALDGRKARETFTGTDTLVDKFAIGFYGYFAGPKYYIVDNLALTEPLLARLPALGYYPWRIGHFRRDIPQGYIETLRSGINQITDKHLAEYFDRLKMVIRGKIFSWRRFKEIIRFNLGMNDYLIDLYLNPPMQEVHYKDINTPKAERTSWKAEGNYIIRDSGLKIIMDSVYHASKLEMSRDHNDSYGINLYHNDSLLSTVEIPPRTYEVGGGLRVDTLTVPPEATKVGFNRVIIYPHEGDLLYSIGHFRILE